MSMPPLYSADHLLFGGHEPFTLTARADFDVPFKHQFFYELFARRCMLAGMASQFVIVV
jgi:hypothetical protein